MYSCSLMQPKGEKMKSNIAERLDPMEETRLAADMLAGTDSAMMTSVAVSMMTSVASAAMTSVAHQDACEGMAAKLAGAFTAQMTSVAEI